MVLRHSAWLGLPIVLALAGCFEPEILPIIQHEPKDPVDRVLTIRDVATVGNTQPLVVQAVGLVTGLDGTGGVAPPGDLRKLLEKDLRQRKIRNVRHLIDSPDTAMVIVTGMIPPGARKGDTFDLMVTLPPMSKVTSLRGGYLQECHLRIYESAKKLSPNARRDITLQGHILGKGSGHLIVGLDAEGNQEPNLRAAKIWGGGLCYTDRAYYFILNENRKAARFAYAVAQKLNATYQDDAQQRRAAMQYKRLLALNEVTKRVNQQFRKTLVSDGKVAKALNKDVILVQVPLAYRLNHPRFLRVAMLSPLLLDAKEGLEYRRRLQEMLRDPTQTIRAALRLEALGPESIPVLSEALEEKHPLVRFAAAEALAYLGKSTGVDVLAECAEKYPDLRAYALTALAGLRSTACREALSGLLASENVEVRYGAFRALQLQEVQSPEIQGELIDNAFWLHRVAPHSKTLVHYSLHRRAEVVLFGRDCYLVPPFRIQAGREFVLLATEEDDRCTLTRFDLEHKREIPVQCSFKLEDVLRSMAKLGASYSDVVSLLRECKNRGCLSGPLAVNAMPQPIDAEELARRAQDPNYLLEAKQPTSAKLSGE